MLDYQPLSPTRYRSKAQGQLIGFFSGICLVILIHSLRKGFATYPGTQTVMLPQGDYVETDVPFDDCSVVGMYKKGTYRWNQASANTYEFQLDTCPLAPISADEVDSCVKDRTIVFVGDSVTRYQYLSFVHMLEYGVYPSDVPCWKADDAESKKVYSDYQCNSFANANLWANTSDFHFNTNMRLPNECCDCFKPMTDFQDRKIEHRVYTKGGTTVVYLWFAKSFHPKKDDWSGIKGHWMCPPWNQTYNCIAGECFDPPHWVMDLDEALIKVVKPLKPDILIMNAGLHRSTNDWPDSFWHSVGESAQEAVAAKKGKAFWRTTTAAASGKIGRWYDHKALAMAPQYGMQILDAYAFSEPIKKQVPGGYWDNWHGNDIIYKELNNIVFNAICPNERKELLLGGYINGRYQR